MPDTCISDYIWERVNSDNYMYRQLFVPTSLGIHGNLCCLHTHAKHVANSSTSLYLCWNLYSSTFGCFCQL